MSSASPSESSRSFAHGLTLIAFSAILAFISIAFIQPPAAVSEGAPAGVFSSGRALKHLRAIAAKPHPPGTDEHARVREYILSELASLGVVAEVQRATVLRQSSRRETPTQAATVHNLVARLEGTGEGKALMLAAHYDSVPTGPGASDDGAGVAALLETLRALKTGPPLKNDLILLFTDAEELGLLGAHAFADEHPWMSDVGLVLNFEARGCCGPSFMFETSEGNAPLIAEFARAAPRPVANSLMYALYKRLPNDTDMTVFKHAGAQGLNFAYVDRITNYHTALDTPDHADERSLQHHGSQALALARHFGNLNLDATPSRDAIYFNALGPVLIRYSQAWVMPLTILIAVAFVGVIVLGVRRKLLTVAGITRGFFLLASGVAAGFVLGLASSRLVAWLYPGYRFLPWGTPYNARLFEWSLVALVLAAVAALYTFARRRMESQNLAAGALLLWLLLLVASTAFLPGGSYLFAWPLLFALAGLAYTLFAGHSERASWKALALTSVSLAPAVLLVAPTVYMLFILLGTGTPAPALFFLALLAGLIFSRMRLPAARRAWWLPGALCVLAVALFVAGLLTACFDGERRKTNSIFYELNADTGRARWVGPEAAPDEWTSQFLTTKTRRDVAASVFPWDAGTILTDEAPALEAAPPVLDVLEDRDAGALRTLRLRVTSPRGASFVHLYTGAGAEVFSAHVNGKRALGSGDATMGGEPQNYLRLFYSAPPAEGIELQLEVSASRPLTLTVVDGTFGLPEIEGLRPRPADMMPRPSKLGDVTLIRKTFVIDAK